MNKSSKIIGVIVSLWILIVPIKGVTTYADMRSDSTAALAGLLSQVAIDYEQDLDSRIQAHNQNTLAEASRFMDMLPSAATFLGDNQIQSWQQYCNDLGTVMDDYKPLLQKAQRFRQIAQDNFQAAQNAKDVFEMYRDVDAVTSAVLNYLDIQKTLLHRLSQQLKNTDVKTRKVGIVHLGNQMLSPAAKKAYQARDINYGQRSVFAQHQYQLAQQLEELTDGDAKDDGDVSPRNQETEDIKQMRDALRKQAQTIQQLRAVVGSLQNQFADFQETFRKVQQDGFSPLIFDRTGLISQAEREALDQLMDVIRQNTMGEAIPTSTPTHNHKQRMALRQQLKKVRKQLNHRHLSRSKRQRLLKLQKRLLKQLHRK